MRLPSTKSSSYSRLLIDSFCLLLLLVMLLLPNQRADVTLDAFVYLPLEAVALGWILLVRGRIGWALRLIASTALALGLLVKTADMACFEIYARPFNPIFDAYLLRNGLHLLEGVLGYVGAILVAVFLAAFALGLIWLAFWLLGRLAQRLDIARQELKQSYRFATAILLTAIPAGLWLGDRAATPFYDLLASHWIDTNASIQELANFKHEIAANRDLQADLPGQQLFNRLKGKDFLLVFIESYGRSALDNPEFGDQLRPLLQQGGEQLEKAGLHSRSAYLTSPTMGGLSWLAQGTALSGLWINSQVRYDSLVMSQRASLNQLFRRAGWRMVAVKPAITLDWPEGTYFGYDQVYTAPDLGYQGKPFDWVTMPDQYTLSAFEALERKPGQRPNDKPVMAEVALISSHAPWTPVPKLVSWQDVKNGKIFDSQATSGDSAEYVWQDDERIRSQYRQAVAYSLETVMSYAQTYGDDNLVILAFGDHQPAPLVTGDTPSRDVPVHLIARDPAVLDAIADWQWTRGMLPDDHAPQWPMSDLRDQLVGAFSNAAPALTAIHTPERAGIESAPGKADTTHQPQKEQL
ncbi:MAG: hypothetical protein EOO53_18145 [Gammaproteobacteria bacterium]|nr:MAG: hypothetical protein EOO53_18145 [Gammaproteobacteria bacterium]